ncbi:hypothetical protein [Legionella drozanskii]|uniref:Thioesterase domain-containing protein n=1 Tax=Legionella drozanskii LLAP-1 TaxID=1212489 RepID=A0A0W0SRK5_9GAMM|nr:hypothetical protein [Legionella drozanskii]KTC85833.1 hypothetical protein Ldro_2158 [Legionella drozanskii LLAP-1]
MRSRYHNNKLCKLIFYFFLLLSSMYLTGCIDLAATQSLSKDKNYLFKSNARVFVMRGGLGGVFSTGMNQLQSTLESKYRIRSESTVWYKVDQLTKYISKNYGTKELPGPIILAGHSLGANEQIKVAKNLAKANIPVELLITIDAVSPLEVPPNVRHVVNIYKPSFVPMFSGLRVKAIDPRRTTIENINVERFKKVALNHFTIDKSEEVQDLMINRSLAAISNSERQPT